MNNRFYAQFRDLGKDYFVTDCAWGEQGRAEFYVRHIVENHSLTAAGQVWDSLERKIIYSYDRYNGEGQAA